MFRCRSRILIKEIIRSERAVGYCYKQEIRNLSACVSTNMGDKFKLPSRYGAGEKSVW